MKSPDLAADADPGVAAVVRLPHRRRGWIWATVVSAVAWLTAAGLFTRPGTGCPGCSAG